MSEESKKIITINVVDVFRILKADKKKLLIYSIIAGVIGIILAFATPKIYKSTVVLAPEESGAGFSGSISSLASMVGMNMKIGQTGDAIYPEIYPELVSSTNFIVDLFDVKVTKDKTNETYGYAEYLQKHQKVAIYNYPKNFIVELIQKLRNKPTQRGEGEKVNPFRLTKDEYDISEAIKANIDCSVDKKTDVITITITDQDPLIAATLADSVKQHLQIAITDYRTKKARVDLEYMETLYEEARSQYDKARQLYASYADANQEVNLQSFKLKEDDLENDMQLKYNIYTTVVEQLQLAKSKVQERTPAFTTLQNATVPVKHSSRPKIVTLVVWMILGFVLRASMLAWKNKEKFVNI